MISNNIFVKDFNDQSKCFIYDNINQINYKLIPNIHTYKTWKYFFDFITENNSNDISNIYVLCPTFNTKKPAVFNFNYEFICKINKLEIVDIQSTVDRKLKESVGLSIPREFSPSIRKYNLVSNPVISKSTHDVDLYSTMININNTFKNQCDINDYVALKGQNNKLISVIVYGEKESMINYCNSFISRCVDDKKQHIMTMIPIHTLLNIIIDRLVCLSQSCFKERITSLPMYITYDDLKGNIKKCNKK